MVFTAPQMADMFAAMKSGDHLLGGYQTDGAHELGLGLSLPFLGFQSWFWMRAALNARHGYRDADRPTNRHWQLRWAPRLTIVPIVFIAISPVFPWVTSSLPLSNVPVIGVGVALVACLVLGLAGWHLRRRKLVGPRSSRPMPTCRTGRLFVAAPGGVGASTCALAAALGLALVAYLWPSIVNGWLHTPTAAFLALGCLVAANSVALAFLRDISDASLRFLQWLWGRSTIAIDGVSDVLGLVALIAVPFIGSSAAEFAGHYDVEFKRWNSTDPRPDINEAMGTYRTCHGGGTTTLPAIIVALEGGASRSAVWSLSAMRMLDERTGGAFGRHLFAISGVSGGSLGAATYSLAQEGKFRGRKAVPTNNEQLGFWKDSSTADGLVELARADLLSSSIARLFTTDAFLGLPWRGESLALAFEDHWRKHWKREGDKPEIPNFISLRDESACLPHVILNGVDVADGGRLLTSTLKFEGLEKGASEWLNPFSPAIDVLTRVRGDISMASAVLNSARFPIISPPGRMKFETANNEPARDRMVIDGGVFENLGVRSARELAESLRNGNSKLEPIVVVVSNDVELDESQEPPSHCLEAAGEKEAGEKGAEQLRNKYLASVRRNTRAVAVPEFLTSVLGLYNTRRGHALGEIAMLRAQLCKDPVRLFQFNLPRPDTASSESAPMNWVLNENACRFILGKAPLGKYNQKAAERLRLTLGDLNVATRTSASNDEEAKRERENFDASCSAQPSDPVRLRYID